MSSRQRGKEEQENNLIPRESCEDGADHDGDADDDDHDEVDG